MDVIKTEAEVDPLAIHWSDNTVTDEKKPLPEEGNLLDLHVAGIKTECVDDSYDLILETKVEETAVPTEFVSMKCKDEMSGRKKWDPQRMRAAVEAVKSKEMGSFKASRIFGVPQTTLERYVKNEKRPEEIFKEKLGRKPVFDPEMEDELARHCLTMEERFFGLSRRDVCQLAFQLAKQNDLPNPFSKGMEQAGKKWLKNFLRRNPQLSVRTPQGQSFARVKGFTPDAVGKFFDVFEPAMNTINYNPSRLFNCDETGITVVQHKHTKVVSLKGKKQIASLQAAERSALITIVTCMSPCGQFIPPMIIFPRKNMKMELMNGAPLGSIYACHPSGWIQTDIFTEWFRHFLRNVKPTEDDPIVLVLDGNFTHVRNIDVITLARENHVSIVSLPPHSTHKMQPLEASFMGPLKTFYAQEIETWNRNHPGRVVTVYQIAELFGKAYLRAATGEAATNGFRKAGLFPCNRNIFGSQDFPHPEISTEDNALQPDGSIMPGTSNQTSKKRHIAEISFIPELRTQQSSMRSQSDSTRLVTGHPCKKQLEDSQKRKEKTLDKPTCRGRDPLTKQASRQKRSLPESPSDSDTDSDVKYCGTDSEDVECLYCSGLFCKC
ncbi:jerky protein homolog-like [Periplaneta americana]|uniref:jerky protein homolog-like n=1 Tax=Periplaneta americana TaxID=6978 RepID=UPI0037E78E86